MKKAILICLLLLPTLFIQAQIKAITDTGDEVVLNADGTWKFVNKEDDKVEQLLVNTKKFNKDKKSTFLIKSKKVNVGIWINPKEWKLTSQIKSPAAEFIFRKRNEDLYAMMITEKSQIPLESLKNIAIINAQNASPDAKIIKQEYRNVNGVKVIMMQMTATLQGIKFVYYNYYYSNSNGAVQLLTYTSENLFEHYKKGIETFLNGFVER